MCVRVGAARLLLLVVATGAAVLWWQAPAAARHNFSMLEVDPAQAAPGDEVTVRGFSYTEATQVRFGALDGPVLATLEPSPNNDIEATVRIPADAEPGRHVLFAMHTDVDGNPTRFPGQAAITVVGAGGPPLNVTTGLEVEPRPAGLVLREPASSAELAMVALATVGAASLVTALAAGTLAARRDRTGGMRP